MSYFVSDNDPCRGGIAIAIKRRSVKRPYSMQFVREYRREGTIPFRPVAKVRQLSAWLTSSRHREPNKAHNENIHVLRYILDIALERCIYQAIYRLSHFQESKLQKVNSKIYREAFLKVLSLCGQQKEH